MRNYAGKGDASKKGIYSGHEKIQTAIRKKVILMFRKYFIINAQNQPQNCL